MNAKEIIAILCSSGGLVLLLTIVEVSKIKINPWSALSKGLCRIFFGPVLKELGEIKKSVAETRNELNTHICTDDARNADVRRANILRFNNELIRDIPHTKEEFIEILVDIDYYERYCKDHPEYPNTRAVHAIANIGRVYDERMKKHDFL